MDKSENPNVAEWLGVEVGEWFRVRSMPGVEFRILADGHYETDPPCAPGSSMAFISALNNRALLERQAKITARGLEVCRAAGARFVSRDSELSTGAALWVAEPNRDAYLTGTVRFCEAFPGDLLGRIYADWFPGVRPGECVSVEELPE